MPSETMKYSAFVVTDCLEIYSSALTVRCQIEKSYTSSPDSSQRASEWTARQYTADIFGAFIEFLTGVEKSSTFR